MAERKSFLLRVNRELLDRVQQLADRDLRSLNGQIEFLLWQAVKKTPPPEEAESGLQEE